MTSSTYTFTEIKFTVYGNQLDPKRGNPIPYTRTTQGQKHNDKYLRYVAYKGWIVAAYLDVKYPDKVIRREDFGDAHDTIMRHPILGKRRGHVKVKIFNADETHGDPDNVAKAVLDALFEDDKHITSENRQTCKSEVPRVEITIELENQ